MVKQRANLILLVLLLALFAGWWGLALLQSHTKTQNKTGTTSSPIVQEPVLIHSQTSDNDTIYSGSLAAAAGCVELGTGVSVLGTKQPHVILQFVATPQPCPPHATSTDNSFSVSVKGNAVLDQVIVNSANVQYRLEKDSK